MARERMKSSRKNQPEQKSALVLVLVMRQGQVVLQSQIELLGEKYSMTERL